MEPRRIEIGRIKYKIHNNDRPHMSAPNHDGEGHIHFT
jgi:hypothetical protein